MESALLLEPIRKQPDRTLAAYQSPGGGQKESNVRSIARRLLSVAVAAVTMTLSTTTGSADAAVQKYPPAYNMKSQYLGAYRTRVWRMPS